MAENSHISWTDHTFNPWTGWLSPANTGSAGATRAVCVVLPPWNNLDVSPVCVVLPRGGGFAGGCVHRAG